MCMVLKKPIGMLVILLLLLFDMNTTVFALEVPDVGRNGSISVTMQDPETLAAVPGGTMTLYRVADIQKENKADFSFALTSGFAGSDEKLEMLDADLAQRLADYAKTAQISGERKEIGGDGKAVFDNLKPGLFLLVQERAANGYYAVTPCLMTIPLKENGVYTYDVDAAPKLETLKERPTDPEPPTDQPGTGDTTRLDLWLSLTGMSGILLCMLSILGRKRKVESCLSN